MAASVTAAPAEPTAAPSDGGFSETIFGCPISSYIAFESACATGAPACATNTPESAWDAGCCTSLSVYGVSLASCFSANIPACLDTSALDSSFSASPATGVTDPCAAFFAGATTAPAGKSTGAVDESSQTSSESSATSEATSAASTASTKSSSSGSTAATTAAKSAGIKVGAGLKVYIGVALLGALTVLTL